MLCVYLCSTEVSGTDLGTDDILSDGDEEIRRFSKEFCIEDLEVWFQNLVKQYEKWAKFEIEWKKVRNTSIRQIEFPFPYREGSEIWWHPYIVPSCVKRNCLSGAYRSWKDHGDCISRQCAQSGEGLGEKIFYLTAKTITRTVAEQAFSLLKEQGLSYKMITLTAKDKICFCEEVECNPDACPYARGHFDRVNDAVFNLITNCDEWNRGVLEEQAKKYGVCPFEMSLDVSNWADAVTVIIIMRLIHRRI